LRLLLLTSSFPLFPGDGRAAAGLFVADLAAALAGAGHDVLVATPDRPGEKAAWSGFRVEWLPWRGGDRPLSQIPLGRPAQWPAVASLAWGLARRIRRLAAAHQTEATIALWAVPCGWWARGLRRRAGVPYVNWCLGSDVWVFGRRPLLRRFLRAALRDSEANFGDGLDLAAEAEAVSRRRCEFLPSTRDLPACAEATAPAPPGPRPLFLFVGRYLPVKGADVLLEAFALYLRRGGRGRLVMRGGGPLAEELRRRGAAAEFAGRVEVGGFADAPELARWLDACDAVVVPSRLESIPLIYSDALKRGRPLIVTEVGDMGVLMRRHRAGLAVPPEDPEALAAALLAVDCEGTAGWAAAVRRAAAEFELAASAERLLAPLRLAAGGRKEPAAR
jgi:glycosyltransferase involved in cell wall biosynthesis